MKDLSHQQSEGNVRGNELILGTLKMFMRLGIKALNMDDIATGLGVSKKTLYKYVTDKRDLVGKAFALQCKKHQQMMAEAPHLGANAIDAELVMMKQMHGMLSEMHPGVMFDLNKYYGEELQEMMAFRDQTILQCVEQNVARGIQEGMYRKEMDAKTVAQLLIALIGGVHTIAASSEDARPLHELFLETFNYHIRGIASPKGLDYLAFKIAQEKNKA